VAKLNTYLYYTIFLKKLEEDKSRLLKVRKSGKVNKKAVGFMIVVLWL
jgi:hypothetical protein